MPAELVSVEVLAFECLLAGLWETARTLYGGLATLVPSQAAYHLGFGAALEQLGLHEEARSAWEAALASSPGDAMALVNLAEHDLEVDDLDLAAARLEQARARLDPTSPLYEKAVALARLLDRRRSCP